MRIFREEKIIWLIIGALFVSALEIYADTIIYTETFWENINKKIGLFIPQIIYFCGLLYTSYFFLLIWRILEQKPDRLSGKIIFLLYYLAFIWCISYPKYTSPLSYAGSVIYDGVVSGEWMDIKNLIRKRQGIINV